MSERDQAGIPPSSERGARTRVGIAEWARRARGARSIELQLADALGRALASAPDGSSKVALAAAARRDGWHAELWDGVVPVLHDLDDGLASVDGLTGVASIGPGDPQAAAAAVRAQLTAVYRVWRDEATPVADAPVIRVLELVLRDHDDAGAL